MTGTARLTQVVIDTTDPPMLAGFYHQLTGWKIDTSEVDDGWVQLHRDDGGVTLAFQRAPGHRAPDWPEGDHPQQLHLDLEVDDLDAGEERVLAIGARRADHQPGERFRVFLDPAGHPFCLVLPPPGT